MSGEDGGAFERSKDRKGKTETTRQLCIPGWSGLRGWQRIDGNSQENTSWGECV